MSTEREAEIRAAFQKLLDLAIEADKHFDGLAPSQVEEVAKTIGVDLDYSQYYADR